MSTLTWTGGRYLTGFGQKTSKLYPSKSLSKSGDELLVPQNSGGTLSPLLKVAFTGIGSDFPGANSAPMVLHIRSPRTHTAARYNILLVPWSSRLAISPQNTLFGFRLEHWERMSSGQRNRSARRVYDLRRQFPSRCLCGLQLRQKRGINSIEGSSDLGVDARRVT